VSLTPPPGTSDEGILLVQSISVSRPLTRLALLGAATAAATALGPAALASAASVPTPPSGSVAALIGPSGGVVSGFGITVRLAPKAVASPRQIILSVFPDTQDVTPPAGQTAVKTFGVQECAADFSGCTSVNGNFPNSPGGTQQVAGRTVHSTAFQKLSATPNSHGNTSLGTMADKRVTISTQTAGTKVFIYNPNPSDTAHAYPKLLPSTSMNGVNTFKTFMPIQWAITSPTSAASGTVKVNAGTGDQAATGTSSNAARDAELAVLGAGGLALIGWSGRRLSRRAHQR